MFERSHIPITSRRCVCTCNCGMGCWTNDTYQGIDEKNLLASDQRSISYTVSVD